MKRKVIQIANSTQLVSLPRQWCKEHNLKKGDEVDVEIEGNEIRIMTAKAGAVEAFNLDATGLSIMLPRYIHALYKRGIDEVRVAYNKPQVLEAVQKALGKETVGFEIVDQGQTHCTIKNVSGDLEDFDSVLRRTFLLLISMGEESLMAIKRGDSAALGKTAFLEEANNRFTTTCRRLLNKKGVSKYRKTGPLYFIIEELENIADQYKYMLTYLAKQKKLTVSRNIIQVYSAVNEMVKLFYELFYKFDREKVVKIGEQRKSVVGQWYKFIAATKNPVEIVIMHNLVIIAQKVFCMLGPCIVLNF